MITYASDDNFQQLISEGVVLVDFFGIHCGPCKMLERVLQALDSELPIANIVKVDVEQCPKAAEAFQVHGIPDIYFFQDGEVKEHFLGMRDLDTLRDTLTGLMYG